jgi:hypothetical protein
MGRATRGLAVALSVGACLLLGQTAVAAAPAGHSGHRSCTMTPTGEYPTADPASLGLDPVKLGKALDYASLDGSSSVKVFR